MDDPEILQVLLGIVVFIVTVIVIIAAIRLLLFYTPRIVRFFKRILPKMQRELNDLIDNLWDVIWGSVKWEDKVIKQEIHHHYVPQYDHSQKTENITRNTNISHTQHITDSVYYSKGGEAGGTAGAGGGGTCPTCGNALQAGWNVCPICADPINR